MPTLTWGARPIPDHKMLCEYRDDVAAGSHFFVLHGCCAALAVRRLLAHAAHGLRALGRVLLIGLGVLQ